MVAAPTKAWLTQVRRLVEGVAGAGTDALLDRYATAFPMSFAETHPVALVPEYISSLEEQAIREVPILRLLGATTSPDRGSIGQVRLALFWPSPAPALLSDVFPVLENLGLRVVAHTVFEVRPADRAPVLVEEFALLPRDALALAGDGVRHLVTEAFDAVWSGAAENDGFNRLVLRAGLSWREVMVLRAVSAYLRQARTVFTPAFTERTLLSHTGVARLLIELFRARFDPALTGQEAAEETLREIESALATVENLTEDRLLRSFLTVLTGTVRTNYFQTDHLGQAKAYLVLKLEPSRFRFLPQPVPSVETLVYSPRMEGLHLRAARISRGGIRWSDRPEDYRTEVLALMKAQRVKNAVIVPQGAKGAFVLKRPPSATHVETLSEELRDCYTMFVRGLLEVTDNLVDGEVVPPTSTRCHDEPDPYLVIAADKGTAAFSDLANSIAAESGFWLGDGFASGGSKGYDHKALGVTARGMWESLRRHLGELGIDPTRDPVDLIGIGDMSGDVFGNALLLSNSLRLVAAFDHRHIFLDPDPDPVVSYAERKRLFGLPGSSWADYDPRLISTGGGAFSRTAKSIPLSEQARTLLGVTDEWLSADELIRAVLCMPADVLLNGGVGTYVKATGESSADVGDRANDTVRVDARQLRARVVAEGGNLGLTQRARVEYALAGGRINADFVDNSAGVETSDREVNLKILLDGAIRAGRLDPEQRDLRLRQAADQVVAQVLDNNAGQAQSISVSEVAAPVLLDQFGEMIRFSEQRGALDRALEFLPDEETLARRREEGTGLTRPEIAVLLAMSKNTYTLRLLESDVPDDPGVWPDAVARYLPPVLGEFGDLLAEHPLRRELAVSVLVNEVFNRVGPGMMLRVRQLTGDREPNVVLGYLACRDVLALHDIWAEIDRLDIARSANVATLMLFECRTVVERATRWFLRHRHVVDPAAEIARLRPGFDKLAGCLHDVLPDGARAKLETRIARLVDAGAPPELARDVCVLRRLSVAFDLVEAAHDVDVDLPWFAEVYFRIGEELELDWLARHAIYRGSDSHWLVLAMTSMADELWTLQRQLSVAVLDQIGAETPPAEAIHAWQQRNVHRFDLYRATLAQLHEAPVVDLAMVSVAAEGLRTLLYAARREDAAGCGDATRRG